MMKKIIIVICVIALLGSLHFIFSGRKLGDPAEYQGLSSVDVGKKAFSNLKCDSCHKMDDPSKLGGSLKGILGKEVEFVDGSKLIRDEAYLKDSILNPLAKIVKGRTGVMIPFKHYFYPKDKSPREKELNGLVAYLTSLK